MGGGNDLRLRCDADGTKTAKGSGKHKDGGTTIGSEPHPKAAVCTNRILAFARHLGCAALTATGYRPGGKPKQREFPLYANGCEQSNGARRQPNRSGCVLPATLPLLGTGRGFMGLVGWWRKRRSELLDACHRRAGLLHFSASRLRAYSACERDIRDLHSAERDAWRHPARFLSFAAADSDLRVI